MVPQRRAQRRGRRHHPGGLRGGGGGGDRLIGAAAGSHPAAADVRAARSRIAGIARATPLRAAAGLDGVLLKLENRQVTGSFKVRGAASKILALDSAARKRGLVAVSSGNHGRAVAHVAGRLGLRATICLTSRVPPAKVEGIEREGAVVMVAGATQEEAEAAARDLADREGLTFVHPFDDFHVIAGQGTVGLEIAEQAPSVATVLIPLSGGGLAGGSAVALAAAAPAARVVGVSQEAGPAMHLSLAAGRLVDVDEEDTLADALAGGLGPVNRHSFALCRRHLTGTVLVSEDEIAAAMVRLRQVEGELVEGGGAVAYAALLAGKVAPPGPVVAVISGGNVAPEQVAALAAG